MTLMDNHHRYGSILFIFSYCARLNSSYATSLVFTSRNICIMFLNKKNGQEKMMTPYTFQTHLSHVPKIIKEDDTLD